MALTQTQVSQLYVSLIGRASEGEGNTFWQAQDSMLSAATEMLTLDVVKDYFGATLDSNQAFIEFIYENTLGKTIEDDPDGIAFWVEMLDGGTEKAEVVVELINAATDPANAGDAQDQFLNRVDVSNYTADSIESADPADFADFAAYLTSVDHTAASVTAAKAVVFADSDANVPVPGDDFMLTSDTDNITGTANDDSFDASIVQNPWAGGVSNSLSTADTLDGGAGTDTLYAELVPEFFGVTGDNQMDVQPEIQNVEDIRFEAMDVMTSFNPSKGAVIVDAKNITDVVKIGSSFSDGDLYIENLTTLTADGTLRNTEEITITMDHTDNFNSDDDASDLTVYFDEDYLVSGQATTSSQANYWLLDEDSEDYTTEPLLNIERDGVSLTIDGEAFTIEMDAEVAAAADSWTAFADALQNRIDEMIAEGETALEGLTVVVDDTNTDETYNDFGDLVTIPAISVVDSLGRELIPTGFTSPKEATGSFDIYGRFDNEDAEVTDKPITVSVELEKVGRDGEGGDLVIGGKDQNLNGNSDVDHADGIEVFNIDVLGDSSQPSNLGTISSTNNTLATVNIATGSDYAGSGDVADLTVREMLGQGQELTLIDATSFEGDFSLAQDSDGQEVITAKFGVGDDFLNWTSSESDGVASGKDYSLSMGAGDDMLYADLDGDSVDAIGESFSVATGSGADVVYAYMASGVSQETMFMLDNTSINTGSDADRVTIDGYGRFDIATETGDDYVEITSNDGLGGEWTFGTTTGTQTFVDRVLYHAELTVNFAGFESTVSVDTDAAGNFVADQSTINAAIIEAIDDSAVLSELLDYELGTGDQFLTITSDFDGENELSIDLFQPELVEEDAEAGQVVLSSSNLTAIRQGIIDTTDLTSDDLEDALEIISEFNDGANDNLGDGSLDATGDDLTAAQYDYSFLAADADATADATLEENFSVINTASGDDIVVLHSNDTSANTLVFDSAFDSLTVVNFFDDAARTETGDHILDFTYYLDNQQDPSDALEGNTQSVVAIPVTYNGPVSATDSTDLDANEFVVIKAGSFDDDDTFDDLTASDFLAAINDDDASDVYGNIDDATLDANGYGADFFGSVQDNIVFVENDSNLGEYKVFHLTAEVDSDGDIDNDDGDFESATLLGTIDFGASITEDPLSEANLWGSADPAEDGDTSWDDYYYDTVIGEIVLTGTPDTGSVDGEVAP